MTKQLLLFFIFFVLIVDQTFAVDRICKIFNYACDANSMNTPGDTYPAAADAYNNNPSSIPTEKTPIGLEVLLSVSNEEKPSFGFFKGYGQFGLAGGSVSKKNSFFSNSPNANAYGIAYPYYSYNPNNSIKAKDWGPDINKESYYSGFAIPLFKDTLKDFLIPYVGIAGRYYTESKQLRESFGLSLSRDKVHFGMSYSKTDEGVIVENRNIGVKIQKFSVDITRLINTNIAFNSNKTWIYSCIYRSESWILLGSVRFQEAPNLDSIQKNMLNSKNIKIPSYHYFFGAQYDLNKILSVGIYFNYVLEKNPYLGFRLTLGNI